MFGYEKNPIHMAPRVHLATAAVGFCFLVLVARLWVLQVVQGEAYKEKSENNRVKVVFEPPPRGIIYDRNDDVLAKNRPAFNIELFVSETPDVDLSLRSLAEVLGEDVEVLRERVRRQPDRRRFVPRVLLRDVSREVVGRVMAHRPNLPGVVVRHYPARVYPNGELAAHVLGYIREISSSQLENARFAGYYRRGDLVGQYGLESKWEELLQGRRGHQRIIVNVKGIKTQELPDRTRAIPGHNLKLTIDRDVQAAAERAIGQASGAAVAVNVQTGEILALASKPAFDPNDFIGEVTTREWQELVAGASKPLSNRAVQGVFAPGSTFKVMIAAAALQEGVVREKEGVFCPGFYMFAGRPYRCHHSAGHGSVDAVESLKVSCNIYYYTVGQRLGVDRIHQYGTQFGLGSPTGLELVHEAPGLVPSTAWKAKHYAGTEQEKWFPGETLSVAIGQGNNQVTPLQMALAYGAVANGGRVLQPQLVKGVFSVDGQYRDEEFEPVVKSNLEVDPHVLEIIREGLWEVVNAETGGTGRRARLPKEWGIEVAGKTGTTQVVGRDKASEDSRFAHHAWFVGFAPYDVPEIVVSALMENVGEGGGKAAAPVVRQIMEAYFSKSRGLELPESGS